MSQESFDEAVHRGRKAMRKQKFSEAIDAFRMAVTLEPDNPEAHNSLATACYMGKEFEEAARHFNRVTQLKPRDAKAFVNLGALYNQIQEHQKAGDILRKAIHRDGKSAEAYYNLGIAQKNLGQNAMAVNAYRECVRLKPEMAEAHLNLANLYVDQKNHKKGVEHYEKSLEARPGFGSAQRGLKRVQQLQEQSKREFSPFGRLVDTDELAAKNAVLLTKTLSDEERFEDRRFLQLTTEESGDLASRIQAHLRDHVEPAVLALNRIISQNPDHQQALFEAREKFHHAYRQCKRLFDSMQVEFQKLRQHEEQMKG
jgi:tetratricopeptide (TPR) repeat protein